MNVDFSKQAGAEPVPADPTPTPPPTPAATPAASVPATTKPVAPPSIFGGTGGMVLGDKIPEFKEIVLPRINIGQGIGDVGKDFGPGQIVWNQQLALFVPPKLNKDGQVIEPGTPPVIMVVLGFRPTRYCEKVPGGGKGAIVDTEDAVRAAGGTLDYNEWKLKEKDGIKRFEPMADALVAIQRPEAMDDDDTVFNFAADGQKYALALWAMRGVSYTAAAKKVFFTGRSVGILKKGYPTWSFAVSTRHQDYAGGHSAWLPVCLPNKKTTEAFLVFAGQVLAAPQTEAADDAAE